MYPGNALKVYVFHDILLIKKKLSINGNKLCDHWGNSTNKIENLSF